MKERHFSKFFFCSPHRDQNKFRGILRGSFYLEKTCEREKRRVTFQRHVSFFEVCQHALGKSLLGFREYSASTAVARFGRVDALVVVTISSTKRPPTKHPRQRAVRRGRNKRRTLKQGGYTAELRHLPQNAFRRYGPSLSPSTLQYKKSPVFTKQNTSRDHTERRQTKWSGGPLTRDTDRRRRGNLRYIKSDGLTCTA